MIYLLYGMEEYLIEKETEAILLKHQIDAMNCTKYSLGNDTLTHILNDCDSFSLFSNKKAILVKNAYIFTSSNKKNPEQDVDLLEDYVNHPNENTILIFMIQSEKLDERKKITKLFHKKCAVKECNTTNIESLVQNLFDDYSISKETIQFFINRVGNNITLLSSEIEKIKLYKDTDKTITKEDIESLCAKSLENNNFKLIDAIITKKKDLAIELYEERLKSNEEPIAIMIALANQIRILYQVKELYLQGHTENDIASILSIHPYRVKLASQNAKKYDSSILLKYLKDLADLDIAIKTGMKDKVLGLELFILEV